MKRTSAILCALLALAGRLLVQSAAEDPGGAAAAAPSEPAPDAGVAPVDAGGVDAPTGACAPKDVSSFTPLWRPPRARQHVCTEAQLTEAFACSYGGKSAAECEHFHTVDADKTCVKCIFSKETDAEWGPVLGAGSIGSHLNIGGCIGLLEPTRMSCGKSSQSATTCVNAACLTTCFADPKAREADMAACAESAALGGCKTYADADVLCRINLDTNESPAAKCYGDFDEATYQYVARTFCGM